MTRLALLLIAASVILSSLAQLMLKAGMSARALAGASDALPHWQLAARALTQPLVLAGLAAYGASALVWLLVLARVPVSVAYPFVSLGFALTALLAWAFQGEPLTVPKVAGIAVITLGVAILARG